MITVTQEFIPGFYRIKTDMAPDSPWLVTIGKLDLPGSIDTPGTLRQIAAALVRKAEEIERASAVLIKPQPASVKAGTMDI